MTDRSLRRYADNTSESVGCDQNARTASRAGDDKLHKSVSKSALDWFSKDDGEVNSLAELIELIRPLSTNCVPWFRGQRLSRWNVEAAIWRDYKDVRKEEERNLTNRFRARASIRHHSSPRYDDLSTWLSLMQHYGLRTRLLDWTRSPLVAAYFAVESYIYENPQSREDAAIWVLDPHELNVSEEMDAITTSIDAATCEKFLRPAFTDDEKESNNVVAVMAAEKDLRIFVQQGAFTIHSDPAPLNLRFGSRRYLRPLRIPARSVTNFASEIDLCGFRKGDIFPDLGHLADELSVRPV